MGQLTDYMSQFEEVYRNAIKITGEERVLLRLLLAAATAQHLGVRTELFWLIIIGPSAGAKTTLLNPLLSCKNLVVSRDDCTGNAMLSAFDPDGDRAKARITGDDDPFDPSLVKVLDGKLFVIKDLTILLNKKDEAEKFWGQMRAAYDGRIEKQSGTIGYQGVESIRYGFIGATTDGSVDGSLVKMSKLGERALYIRVHQAPTSTWEEREIGLQMLTNRESQHIWEAKLARSVEQLLAKAIAQVRARGPSNPRIHNPAIARRVIDLASALAKLRTSPSEENQVPHERNRRTVKQFGTLCDALAICSGRERWQWSDVGLCLRIVRSSLPTRTRLLLDYTATCSFSPDAASHPTANTAAQLVGTYKITSVESQLKQWVNAGVLVRDRAGRFSMPRPVLSHLLGIGVVLKPQRLRDSPGRKTKTVTLKKG